MTDSVARSTIRWGILGTGQSARAFATDLGLLPGAALWAVGSRESNRARAFLGEFGCKHAHKTVEELASNDEVDVVYVATPNVRHRDDCTACLVGGRAVLCEKPFALNASQARIVIEQAQKSRRFCMEAMWMRFHPLLLKVRSLVQSGKLGQIRLLTAELGYPTAYDPENRFFSRELGGGALLDRGIYLLSLAYFLLGRPSDVSGRAMVGTTGVDEQESITLSYPSGALAVLAASLRSRLRNDSVIIGTEGQMRIHDPFYAPHHVSWTRFEEPVGLVIPGSGKRGGWKARIKRNPQVRRAFDKFGRPILSMIGRNTTTFVNYTPGQGYQFEAAEVVRCLRAGELASSVMPLDETLAVLESMDSLRRSWNVGYPGDDF
jgi:predicted dehydrogenase